MNLVRAMRSLCLTLAAALVALLALASPAAAHQLSRGAADLSTGEFLMLGVKHMLLGWDHLLFIAGVLLLARSWQGAAKLITIFVVGHSLTLILGTTLGWQLSAGLVDVVIAGSVIFVGGLLATKTQLNEWVLAAAIGGFGLIHGLGLATQFQRVGVADGVFAKVVTFNVGVEIGQLIAIGVMATLGKLVGLGREARREQVSSPVGLGIVGGGILALALATYFAIFPPVGDATGYVVASDSTCQLEVNNEPLPEGAVTANPPLQEFYGPDEVTPGPVFEHARTDGYLTIHYPASAPAEALTAMQAFVESKEGIGVLAGPIAGDSDEYVFRTFHEIMRCSSFEEQTLREFADAWFKSL